MTGILRDHFGARFVEGFQVWRESPVDRKPEGH